MATHPDYPGASSVTKKGKVYWRFRASRNAKEIWLKGQPGSAEFEASYRAAVEGRAAATIVRLPTAAYPNSLNALLRETRKTARWQQLGRDSRLLYDRYIEEYLRTPAGNGMTIGDGPVAEYRPRHVQEALNALARQPAKAKILMVVLKKMMKVARRLEWIEFNPCLDAEPPEITSAGKEPWPPHVCARFERHWPIGSAPRTAYELARWLGIRRSDVPRVRWDHQVTEIVDGAPQDGFKFVEYKGRNRPRPIAKFHPIPEMLAEALAPLSRETGTVLVQANGQPYKIQSMTAMMWHWRKAAGIDGDYSFHGLRHAMGAMLADAGATGHESRDVLGHETWAQVSRYSKSRDQVRSATGGSRKVVKLVRG
jgi:integrase